MTISKTVRPGSFAPTQWTFGARETGSMKTILLAAIGSLRTLPSPRRTGGRSSRPGEPRTGSPASRRCRDRPRRDRIRTRTPCISTWSFWPSRCSFPMMGNAPIISFPSNGPQPIIVPPLLPDLLEFVLSRAAQGADPLVREAKERRPRLHAVVRIAHFGIVHVRAHDASVPGHCGALFGLSGTGGIISPATKEPQYRRSDLVGMVRPADAAAGEQAPPLSFREPRGGGREARGDHPDPHPRGENLFPSGRLVREGEFGEAVGKVAGPQVPRARVPQEDHGAAGLRPEEREKRPGEKKRPAQVDREDPVPFPFGDIARRRAREDRGVVDEYVQTAEFPFDRIYETEKPPREHKVEREGPPADLPSEGTCLRARGAVGERDGEPIAGESAGDRRADAPGSPGDQRDPSRPCAHFSSMNFSFGAPQMGQGSGGSSPW